MPIGTSAVYAAANLPTIPGGDPWAPMPDIDEEMVVLKPTAPMTAINYSNVGWNPGDRCPATGGTLTNVPIPASYVIPDSGKNNSAAFLLADRRTVVQAQPFTRCIAGGPATSIVVFPNVDLYGTGITGAHGGSGLSALGGSLRIGELRPGGQAPRHVLKVNVYAKQALYKCTVKANCFRWPATTADSYAVGFYGTVGDNNNQNMKMGALLAIPTAINVTTLGLETEPAKQLAWTLQNYGAYIVDDVYGAGFNFAAETGPDGAFITQFLADWGYPMGQRVRDNTPWVRDVQRLVGALSVVANNGPSAIGGGGTPLQPLAVELVVMP